MSFNFSFANGDLPIYSSRPTNQIMATSPVYFSTDVRTQYFAGDNSSIDYFKFYSSSESKYYFVFACTVAANVFWYNTQNYANNTAMSYSYSYNNSNYIRYAYFNPIPGQTLTDDSFIDFGTFDSLDSALFKYQTEGLNYNGDVIRFPFTLQNGYLFVFDCGQSNSMYSFDLSSTSEEYSDIGSIPFPDTNQSYWFSDSLPEIDETTIPNSGATIISWLKGDKTNIFGQTQDMIATISGTSSGRYLYIYNPPVHYKWSGSSNPTASETINYPMIINGVSENETWYIYDSIARLTDFNQGGSVTGTVTGEDIIGSVSSDGAISLVTSSGAIYTQNSGGSTDISSANGGSIAENISGLKQTLDDFVNQFIHLLSAPISHIQQLIQSSHQFFDVFSQLFEWLPSELSSVIVSGLIIMVVIGVIKMLL